MCDQSAPQVVSTIFGREGIGGAGERKNYTLYSMVSSQPCIEWYGERGITRSRRKATNGEDLHGRRRP